MGGPHVILARLRKIRDILTTPTQKINVKIEFPVVCLVVVHYVGVLITQFKPFWNAYANLISAAYAKKYAKNMSYLNFPSQIS